MRKNKVGEGDIREEINLIKKTNSQQRAIQLGKNFIEKAKANLQSLPQNKWNNLLQEIAYFVIKRER